MNVLINLKSWLKGSPADVGDSMKVGTSGPSVMVDTLKRGCWE